MNRKKNILLKTILVLVVFGLTALALEVELVGTIENNLFAPTSLSIEADELAVLEPFSRQLKIFSINGMLTHEVNLAGDAHGLTKISPYTYLFCDRSRKVVTGINAVNGDQYDYYTDVIGLDDPIDILKMSDLICVLDGESSSISQFDQSGNWLRKIVLRSDVGASVQYSSSFVYSESDSRYYVLDQLDSRIWAVDSTGLMLFSFGSFGADDGQITRAGELAVDKQGRVYVADRYQGIVTVFDSDGDFLGRITAFDQAAAVPTGIVVDDNSILYVASTMGVGINMYYVAPLQGIDESVTALQQFPEDLAVIPQDGVLLRAYAEYDQTVRSITGFDFQLYADSTGGDPLAQAVEVVPQVAGNQTESTRQATGEWRPEIRFDNGEDYYWRMRVRDGDDLAEWSAMRAFTIATLPLEYHLGQNFPNPFNPQTLIGFSLARDSEVSLEVYNLLGQKVAQLINGKMEAGHHQAVWDGRSDQGATVSTGVYFYRLSTPDFFQTRKMVLMK